MHAGHVQSQLVKDVLLVQNVNLHLLESTFQMRGMHTIIRDKTTSKGDFIFFADRLIRLVRAPVSYAVCLVFSKHAALSRHLVLVLVAMPFGYVLLRTSDHSIQDCGCCLSFAVAAVSDGGVVIELQVFSAALLTASSASFAPASHAACLSIHQHALCASGVTLLLWRNDAPPSRGGCSFVLVMAIVLCR